MKSRGGLQARTKFHPESIRRKTQKLLKGQTVTTGDSSQNGDEANEQEEPVQPFDEPESNFRVYLNSCELPIV